jgi:hypothetical protein
VSLSAVGIGVFWPVAAFAFFVFAQLILLHVIQWAVAGGLKSAFAANLNPFDE